MNSPLAILRWLLLGLLWLSCAAVPARTANPTTPAAAYLYTGEQIDPDLGMYYLRARYYQPGIGRFWNMDSYEGNQWTPLSLHKYLYCHGNPVNGTDPSGHDFSMTGAMTTAFTAIDIGAKMYTSFKIGHLIGSAVRFSTDDEMTVDELVDESLKTALDIGGGWAIGRGAGYAFNKWIGPLSQKLTPIVWQRCRELGRAAEASILSKCNLLKNSKSLSELGGSGGFIPDGISPTVLREVKNVSRLPLDDQLRAFAAFSKNTGRQFIIHVRPGTRIDGTVINEMQSVFGAGSRGVKWDIISDVPESMRVISRL